MTSTRRGRDVLYSKEVTAVCIRVSSLNGHRTSCFRRVVHILFRRHVDVHKGKVNLMCTHVYGKVKSLIFLWSSKMNDPVDKPERRYGTHYYYRSVPVLHNLPLHHC